MTKDILLAELRSALSSGMITEEEVRRAFSSGTTPQAEKHSRIAMILYYIGGLVVFLGVGFFIGQEWERMISPLRILVTLGFGIALTISGTVLALRKTMVGVSDALQLVAGLLIPTGIFVTLWELGYREGRWGTALIFLALGLLWWANYQYQRRIVLVIFSIVYGSIGYLLIADALLQDFPQGSEWDLLLYVLLALGASYGFLAYAFREGSLRILTGPLYFFGTPIILGATMALQGFEPEQRVLWELLYPILLFGGLYLSVYLKSRSFLVFSGIFLVGFVTKIMFEYFRDTLSGPLMFIAAGILIMATGYLTIHLNKKYFKGKEAVAGR